MPVSTVLVCTVGGSHEPIVTALKHARPDFVVFVCSGKDPATGRPGSDVQIVGAGDIVRASAGATPALPNIPAQAGLAPERFEVVRVAADDLDGAFAAIHEALRNLRARFPDAHVIADYTGGTKTMTAALVTAALESGVALQLVTGSRVDLAKVRDGTQQVALAAVEGIRLERAMAPFLAAWSRYAYEESATGLAGIDAPRSGDLRARLNRGRDLAAAFAAWDRFDHPEALRLLESYAPVVSRDLGVHLGALKVLTGTPSPRHEALQIWDLWLNAQRRAASGRYDDAMARVYRALEWAAQWILRTRAGLDTADLPAGKVEGLVSPNRDGKYQAGLFVAWQLVQVHSDGAGARFFAEHRAGLLDRLRMRNDSILAHGFRPIARSDWERMGAWLEERFIPALRAEMKAAGQKQVFPQLPNGYLWQVI